MKYSFIVACYNSGLTIKKCLDSIQSQLYKNFECIMFDDGSIDNTKSILLEYSKKDNRFKYFYHTNKGTSQTTNDCITVARGIYIVPVDHDDWVDKYYLYNLDKIITKTNADIITCSCDFHPKIDNLWFLPWTIDSKQILIANTHEEKKILIKEDSPMVGTHTQSCIKKSLFNCGVKFEGMGSGADTIVMQVLVHLSKVIVRYENVLYHRLVNPKSVSRQNNGNDMIFLSLIERLFKNIHYFYNDYIEGNPILSGYCRMFFKCRSSILKHNLKYFYRFMRIGFLFFKHRKLILKSEERRIKIYFLLIFPFFPLKPYN